MSETPTDDLTPTEEPGPRQRLLNLYRERSPLLILIGIALLGLAMLCVFAFLLLRDDTVEEPTPTPPPIVRPDVDTESVVIEAVGATDSVTTTVESPIFLNIAGIEYTIQAEVLPQSGPWDPRVPNETVALWVYGSVINYVFGLDDTSDNQALLEGLNAGEEVSITTRSGITTRFVVTSRNNVDSENRTVFAQQQPSITLVLIEEDLEEQRLVVQGTFTSSDTPADQQVGSIVEMGQTAQIEGLQITVNGVRFQIDQSGIPSGFAFYQIDYQVQNVGTTTFNTDLLNMVLVDDFGNLYALNPAASQAGNNPVLGGVINQGQTIIASAGYQIPAGITSTTLRWQVTNVETGGQIQVNIPFEQGGASGEQATVQIQEVSVSPEGSNLIVVGQVTNLGQQPLLIEVSDISLSSDGTVYLMLSTNPAFPWVLAAGQTLLFQVTFQRPFSDTATFKVLNHSFQLTGLR